MIRRLYVHNFRCLENFEFSLEAASSVLLLGRNGAGKSTVGLALELLQSIGRGVNRVGKLVEPRDLTNGRAEAPMRFEVEADLDGDAYSYSIAFDFPSKFRELRVLEEKLHVAGRPVFTRELAEVKITRGDTTSEVTFRIDWHLVALPIVQDQSTQDPIATFKALLSNMLILRPVPSCFQGTTDWDGTEPTVIDSQAIDIAAWFTEIMVTTPGSYSHVSDYLTQVMPDFSSITTQVVGKSTRSLLFHFAKAHQELVIDLAQLSDGEKCFVLYSLVIATSAARKPLLCFWDEPDNFLAPDEVGHSIMGLRRAFRDSGQLLVTSHNPEAIRRFSEDNTFYFGRKSRLEPTTYKTIEAMRQTGDYDGNFIDALLRGDIGGSAES